MNPGDLDCRIEIGENKTIRNAVTKMNVEQWIPFHTCWAEKYEPIGRSYYQAAAAHLEYVVWFNIRPKAGIKPGMQVRYKDRTYDIEQVKEQTRKKNIVSLQCKEVI